MKIKTTSGIMVTFLLIGMLTLAFNIEPVSAGVYPAIYIEPANTVDPDLRPGENYTISIKTDYIGDDITSYQFTLSYNPNLLHGIKVTNGDLITTDKHASALFNPGTFNNIIGELSLTGAFFFFIFEPAPVTSGPGTLANITFTVVGTGGSNITLGPKTKLIGYTEDGYGDPYDIIDAATMPDQIQHGFFKNVQPIHDVAVARLIAPATVFTGQLVPIKVIVANEGNHTESATVKVSYDATEIGTESFTLASGLFRTLSFSWDTTDLAQDTYTITAEAILDGDADLTDNRATTTILISGTLISVPFHHQITGYYCGPGALEMVFDFYGPDISQLEIADVARTSHIYGGTYTYDMTRAAHFSNLSTSVGVEMPENVTGYSARKLGYVAFEYGGFTLEELKSLIEAGYPMIVLTWFTEAKRYGHYRVVVGYNATHVILNDPLFGPMLNWTNSKFLDFWEYSYYWGLFVSPWNVSVSAPQNVREGDTFTVTATVTYPCPLPFFTFNYPASMSNATIILPEEMSLSLGETAKKAVNAGNMLPGDLATVSWIVQADSSGAYKIGVEVEGKISGYVFRNGPYPGYSYEDRIGGFSNVNVTVNPPLPTTVSIYPSTLNLRSGSKWIAAHVELPEDYDVGNIDVSTILLDDVVTAESSRVGRKKLTVRFDRSKVVALLPPTGEAELTVSGTLLDGTPFEGSDSIRVVSPSTEIRGCRGYKR